MRLAYRLTTHAINRMQQRHIAPEEAIAALSKRGRIQRDGMVQHYDPRSRVVVVANAEKHTIITIYRRKRWNRLEGQ